MQTHGQSPKLPRFHNPYSTIIKPLWLSHLEKLLLMLDRTSFRQVGHIFLWHVLQHHIRIQEHNWMENRYYTFIPARDPVKRDLITCRSTCDQKRSERPLLGFNSCETPPPSFFSKCFVRLQMVYSWFRNILVMRLKDKSESIYQHLELQ